MKKTGLILIMNVLFVLLAQAQERMTEHTRDALNYGTFNPNPMRSAIYGVEGPRGSIQGDIYLDSAWHTAEVFFYPEVVRRYDPNASDSIAGYPVRVEVVDYSVEFMVKDASKAVEESAIRKINWMNGTEKVTLVNTRQYAGTGELKGFFQVLADGSLTILKHTKINVYKPTYSVALNVGTKDYRLVKKEEYYYLWKDKAGAKPEKFKPSKSALLELMRSRKSSVEKFIAENDLNLKRDADMVKVVAFYNAGK
ncbi:MAG: hypothetical protein ACK4TA_01590 [Saprospiraceae bacterium]